jgi:hypothetical protein
MTNEDKAKLFRIVRDRLNCGKLIGKRKHVETAIYDAHNGRPDGFLVTTSNMHLFRQYRNGVSPSPAHLVDAALAWDEGGDE